MRASLFAIALTVAASVNAAAVQKRAVSDGVQACIDGLNTAGTQLVLFHEKLNSFTRASNISGVLVVHAAEQAYESRLKAAVTSCCAVNVTVSDEEASAVLGVVDTFVPEMENTLGDIVTRKPDFDAILLATIIFKSNIKNMNNQVSGFDTCLIATTPANVLDQANAYVARVDAAFAATKTAYGI